MKDALIRISGATDNSRALDWAVLAIGISGVTGGLWAALFG